MIKTEKIPVRVLIVASALSVATNIYAGGNIPKDADIDKVNEALSGYQALIGEIVQGLSYIALLSCILALVLQLVRLAMCPNNAMLRTVCLRNIGGTLITAGVLGGWNLMLHIIITSTLL